KKDIIPIIGNFDTNFEEGGEDLDFCVRLRKKGYRIFYNPNALIYHLGSGRAIKKAWRDGKTRAKNFRKHKESLLGAAITAFLHSCCLILSVIFLIFGFFIFALLVILPSLLHRIYRSIIDIKSDKTGKETFKSFLLSYIVSLSFLIYVIVQLKKPNQFINKNQEKSIT
ncbi:MAG: glycosyltransferase family 2 protein, partial [Candidatus Hodarchaeota archaeon]